MRRRQASLAGNPLLIGAVTTLIVIVAVYLSYNANNGLPFVPTYNLKVALPNASGLFKGNDVRIGGTRVGIVSEITPYQEADGRSIAIVEAKLQKNVQPLPADTTDSVLSRSSVGLKYLALFKGSSTEDLKQGATIPISHFRESVQIDEFFDMFNKPTRQAAQEDLINGGDGFAGRGENLNATIHQLVPLTRELIPVMRNLAAPRTGFGRLWRALDRPAEETAPVAVQNADFYSDLDTFFRAWASVSTSLERAIEGGPPSLEQATYSLPHEAPFVNASAEFMRLLRPSAAALRRAAPIFASAVETGTRSLPAARSLNEKFKVFLANLRSFSQNPVVELAFEELTKTLQLGNTVIAGLASEQVSCNYITLTFRNLASALAVDVGPGAAARVLTVLAPGGTNGEGTPASAPADTSIPGSQPQYNGNFLHFNPYPNTGQPGQSPKCEAGNQEYVPGTAVIGHAPPSHVANNPAEKTERKQSLLGETYEAATLKALGISTTKGKGKK